MITGIGLDLVELKRIERLHKTYTQFVDRILSPAEREIFQTKNHVDAQVAFLSGRYAAKEAFSKAYGTGIGESVSFQEIIILNDKKGKPYIARSPHLGSTFITITHANDMAAAQIILEK